MDEERKLNDRIVAELHFQDWEGSSSIADSVITETVNQLLGDHPILLGDTTRLESCSYPVTRSIVSFLDWTKHLGVYKQYFGFGMAELRDLTKHSTRRLMVVLDMEFACHYKKGPKIDIGAIQHVTGGCKKEPEHVFIRRLFS